MKGWSGLLYLVLASVLTVSGILFGGIEYYRAHPFEPDEVQNFMNMLFLGFLPFGLYLIFRYSRVKISEKEFALEMQRRFPEDFQIVSPTGEVQKFSTDTSPHTSLKSANTEGVSAGPVPEPKIGEIVTADAVESAIINYIRMSNGLRFKDQATIARIEKSLSLFSPIQKGFVDQVLFQMFNSGKLVVRDDILYLAGSEQAKPVKIEPVSSVESVKINSAQAEQMTEIVKLLSLLYQDPSERKEQLDFISQAYTPAQYPEVIKQLVRLRQEQVAEQRQRQMTELKRQEILKRLQFQQNQPEYAGTGAGQNGTVKKNAGTGLKADWDSWENQEEETDEQ